jgi:cytochrome P450
VCGRLAQTLIGPNFTCSEDRIRVTNRATAQSYTGSRGGDQGSEIYAYYADPIASLSRIRAQGVRGCPITPGLQDPVVVCDADETRRILNDSNGFQRSGAVYGGHKDTALYQASYGLLAMNGEEHSLHRQQMLAFFRDRSRESLFAEATMRAVESVTRGWHIGEQVDVAQAARHISFAVLCDTTFSIAETSQQRRLAERLDAWIRCCMLPDSRLLGKHGDVPAEAEQMSRDLIELMLDLIKPHRDSSRQSSLVCWLFDTAEQGVIDSAALIGQLVTMLTAGWETTSAAIAWTLALLAHHHAVARELHQELAVNFDGTYTKELHRLPILDSVVRESLRLLPPAPGIKRIATHKQEVVGFSVEASAEVICSPYLLHRDSSVYPDALRFSPERWSLAARPGLGHYLPFGLGWRRCVGERLALIELKTVLASLLARYAFAVPVDSKIDYQVRLSFAPSAAVCLKLRAQGDWQPSVPASGTWRQLVEGLAE